MWALEQSVRLRHSQAFIAEALQKASGQPANTRIFSGSRARRGARCSLREVGSSSDGRKLAQSSLILQQLLDLGRTPGEDEVSEILRVELDDWRRNPRRATVILSSLAKHKLPHTATYVLTAMMAKSVEANVFHYNAAINACEKGRQWQLAVGLLSSMPDMRVIPDEISYNAASSACSKGGQWELALGLLRSMPEMGMIPDEVSYNAAMSACEKGGQWQLAMTLLNLMPEARVVPDRITFNAAISACEKGGHWQLALELLSLMPAEGVVPNEITFNAATSACEKGGQWQL
ncbi:unnamed protein product, partial [Polarella glacialis]